MPIEENRSQFPNYNTFSHDSDLLSSMDNNNKPSQIHRPEDTSSNNMPTTDQSWVHSSVQPEFQDDVTPHDFSAPNKIEQSEKPYPHREAHSYEQHYLTPDTSSEVLASVVDPALGTPVSTTGLGPNPYPIGVNSGQTEPSWLHPVQDDADREKEAKAAEKDKPSHLSKLLHRDKDEKAHDQDEKHHQDKKHHHKDDQKSSQHDKSADGEEKKGLGKRLGEWVSDTVEDIKASVGSVSHLTERPSDPDRVHEETYSVDKAPNVEHDDKHAHLGLPLQRGKFD